MNKQPKQKQESPLDFEKAMQRLDELVREMEGGEISLEKMMSHFEEGTRLLEFCTKKLNEIERKIEQLVQKNGKIELAPFPEEESSESVEPEAPGSVLESEEPSDDSDDVPF